MNKIIIANYRETEPQVISRDGNSFAVKPVIREADAGKCAANFVEVEPGAYAYGYHYHEVNEEVFYIIRGHAVVRTPEGEINLKEGDAIAFPASPEGAHVIRNGSATEKLVYPDARCSAFSRYGIRNGIFFLRRASFPGILKKHTCFETFLRFLRWRGPQERRAALLWKEGVR